jgi:MFS family permease
MAASTPARLSWSPLIVIAIAQVLLAFNITTLKISIDAIVTTHQTSPSAVKNAIIVYSLVVAACVLIGAKIAAMFGGRRVFRVTIACFAVAMITMVLSTDARMMMFAQAAAGAAAAVLGPTAIVLAARHYADRQGQVAAWLSAVRSASLICAFLVAGAIATWSDWRLTYVLLLILAAVAFKLGERLSDRHARIDLHALAIDKVGFALILVALTLIGLGCENLIDWGVLVAKPHAPFSVLMLSPALLVIVLGVVLVKVFLAWSYKQRKAGRATLVVPELLSTSPERSTLFSILTIAAVGSAVTFLIPLYIEVVQGRNSVYTALALAPYTFAAFGAAILSGRMHGRIPRRRIASGAFLALAAGLALLATVIRNDWSDLNVVVSLAIVGAAEGALMTLLFKMMASTVRGEAASDVDPLCSATTHLAIGVGTALAGALVVGLLSVSVHQELSVDPSFADTLRSHVDLDRVSFVSNDHLREVLEGRLASAESIDEAVRINTEARLRALKSSFFALSLLALIAVIPYARSRGTPNERSWSDEARRVQEQPLSGPSMSP